MGDGGDLLAAVGQYVNRTPTIVLRRTFLALEQVPASSIHLEKHSRSQLTSALPDTKGTAGAGTRPVVKHRFRIR
jgi:hypothetical protein